MATSKSSRAPARRVRKPARPRVPRTPVKRRKAPAPKKTPSPDRKSPVPVQRTYSPELLASGRHRYENTPEPIGAIAADFGILHDSMHRVADRLGWVRHEAKPRQLPEASRLLARAQALEEARASAKGPPTPDPSPPFASRMGGGEDLATLSRERERDAGGGEDLATMIDRIEREVREQIAKVSALREQLKGVPPRPRDAQTTARTLSTLTETLEKLQRLRLAQPAPTGPAYDDLPDDIDEFRESLACRIDAFMESRADEDASCATDGRRADAP